jgi:hypothetical protein
VSHFRCPRFKLIARGDLGIYYNGRFNEDYDANAVTGRLGIKF